MSSQIIVQPDGNLALFSSHTETFIVVGATDEEMIEFLAADAAAEAREKSTGIISSLRKGEGGPTSYQVYGLTWEEAAERHRLRSPQPKKTSDKKKAKGQA